MAASTIITGKCLCGQITVTVPEDAFNKPENVGLCYCKNCRQSGGCLASHNLYLSDRDVTVQGQPKIYRDPNTDTGTTVERSFCGNCGSPLYGKNPNFVGLIAVRLGLFDQIPKPGMILYGKYCPDWNKITTDGAQEHQTMPPMTDDLMKWLQEKGVSM